MGNNMNYGRYGRGQMMPRVTEGCETCGDARMMHRHDECETCGDARMTNRRMKCDDYNMMHDQLNGMPLGMSYVPWQQFECTYEPAQAFRAGTIFPELDKPFYGRRGMR